MAQKYRKKPVVIEAMRWDGTAEGATPIIDWALQYDATIGYRCGDDDGCGGLAGAHNLAIDTLEGTMLASAGDLIIKGVSGEFYPCKPDIFAATYEPVKPTDPIVKPTGGVIIR
jgi:hypothetical protein